MKRYRLILVAALAAASLGVAAPPASACQSDGYCPCTEDPIKSLNSTWNKLTGENLFRCTY